MRKLAVINPWHLVTLALAFIAGGALMTDSPFKMTPPDPLQSTTIFAPQDTSATSFKNNPSIELPLFVQNELDDLRSQLSQSREQIAALNVAVVNLEESLNNQSIELPENTPSETFEQQHQNAGITSSASFGTPQDDEQQRNALLRSGIDESTIASIQSRQDQYSLTRLELLDQAAREDWADTDRLRDELEKLEETDVNLRDEIGEEAYDRYLYNSGRSNRVVITSVIQGSTADLSGLQVGDTVLRYANAAVFTMRELRQATREGVRDEPVLIEIGRAGDRLTSNIVRGPLGITMTSERVAPASL